MDARTTLETCWTQRLVRGETPTAADLRDHLLAVHRDHAGFTESCALKCRDEHGMNSYEALAAVIDLERHKDVLDLACGSGALLAISRQRCGPDVNLAGVDISSEELVLARKRNSDASIKLHQGVAQSLHFAADRSIDVVLCHWALTLLNDVPVVLQEIKRVLRPGGVFSAIVDGDPSTAPAYSQVHNIIYGWVQEVYPNYGRSELGDPRIRATDGLEKLTRAEFPDAEVEIRPLVFSLQGTPDILAREASGFFYASFVLPKPLHRQMLDELESLFEEQANGGSSRFALPVNQLVIRNR